MNIDITQLEYIDKNLRKMLDWLEISTGLNFTITSQYRIGDSGVHGVLPLRGIDLRMRNYEIGLSIQELINTHWKYDPQRENLNCCMLHGDGSNLHLHLQTHYNTEFLS